MSSLVRLPGESPCVFDSGDGWYTCRVHGWSGPPSQRSRVLICPDVTLPDHRRDLGVAWSKAEAALPEGWRLIALTLVDVSDSEDLRDEELLWEAEAAPDFHFNPRNVTGLGDTPEAALTALAGVLKAAHHRIREARSE